MVGFLHAYRRSCVELRNTKMRKSEDERVNWSEMQHVSDEKRRARISGEQEFDAIA